jgi:HEAT repeat protein
VRAQTAVEGILGPFAGGVAGLALLLLLKVLSFEAVHLAGLLLLVVAAWATVASLLRHEYATVLAKALASRRLSGVALTLEDASSVAVLQNGLSSPHPGEVLYCLNTLEELGHPSFESSLLELVKHPAAEVRREALLRLERLRLASALGVVRLAVVDEEDATVRSAAIRTLTAVGEPEDLDKAIAYLDDPDAEIRLGAMAGLLRNGGIEGVLIAGERLMEEARAEQASRRALVARLIGEVGVSSFHRPLLSLLEDEDVGVRRAALSAAAQIKNPRLWPLALDALADPQLRSLAMAALVAGGDGAVGLLEEAYDAAERAGDRPGQRRSVRLCSQIRGPRAADMLWRKAECPDGEVRHSILSSLLLIGFKADVDQAQVVRGRIVNEVSEAAGILAAVEDLADGEALDLVTGTLEHALERSRERIFCLLAFVHPADSILKARVNLGSRYPEKRAQAVELIDSLLPLETARLIVPLIEDIPNAERLQRLSTAFPQDRYEREERLRRMVEQADGASPWERASAIHVAGLARLGGLTEPVERALEDPSPLVRETAAWARARLASRDRPSQVYGREAEALVERFVEELEGRRQGVAPMLSTVEKVIILKSVNIFSETPDEILAEVASLLEEVEVEAGERIFEKGDMGSAMYIVVEGRVRVHNQDRTLRELGPRDIFGEMAALDPEPRSASITALAPTHLFRLEQEALYELMADRIEVVRGVISVLCQRLRAVTS